MYRPSAAARTARAFLNQAAKAGTDALAFAADAVMGALVTAGIYEQAQRENRQRNRWAKRQSYYNAHREAGLNGPRAVARRLRQIEAGSLRVQNGLVSL